MVHSPIGKFIPRTFPAMAGLFAVSILSVPLRAQSSPPALSDDDRGKGLTKPLVHAGAGGVANAMSAMAAAHHGNPILPLWFQNKISPRDGYGYFGFSVGKDPFDEGGSTSIPTYIVPVVIVTNTIATSLDPQTGAVTGTTPGVTTFDPTAIDNTCLTAPNNVPVTLFRQSPLFEKTDFVFGSTYVGKTQYVDAFERANVWRVLDNRDDYHLLLDPVNMIPALVVNVPAGFGVAIPTSLSSGCAAKAIVDTTWLDTYVYSTALPNLSAQGVTSGTLPLFMLYKTRLATAPAFADCCLTGYHSWTTPPVQTYVVANFGDNTDIEAMSEQIAQWANDPFFVNQAPLWGPYQGSCQAYLEVGEPLEASGGIFSVKMPNGRTYHPVELAFSSWFLGGPSTAVNGWYSNQGSFLTDAGAPCQ